MGWLPVPSTVGRKKYQAVAVSEDGKKMVASGETTDQDSKEFKFVRYGVDLQRDPTLNNEELEGRVVVAISGDGQDLAYGSGKAITIVSISTDVKYTFEAKGNVRTLALSTNGNWLVSGGAGGELKVWDRSSKNVLFELSKHSGDILSSAISSDSKLLVSGGQKGELFIWDLEIGAMLHELKGHEEHGAVQTVAISGYNMIVSGGSKGELKVWDLRRGEKESFFLRDLEGHTTTAPVHSVAISSDDKLLVSSGSNGELKLWDWTQMSQQPTPQTVREAFEKDMLEATKARKEDASFCWPRMQGILNDYPRAMLEAYNFRKDSQNTVKDTVVHQAARKGRIDFLKQFLLRDESLIETDDDLKRRLFVCAAFVISDGDDRTALWYACGATESKQRNDCIKTILDCYSAVLSETQSQQHVTDRISVTELALVVASNAQLVVQFLLGVQAIDANNIVQKDVPSFPIAGQGLLESLPLLKGSDERTPSRFWDGQLKTTSSATFASCKQLVLQAILGDTTGNKVPVVAKLLPLRGIVGPNSCELLAQVQKSCNERNSFELANNDTIRMAVEFKWAAFACKYFERDLALYITFVLSFSVASISTLQDTPRGSDNGQPIVSWAALVLAAVLWMWFFKHECLQIRNRIRKQDNDKILLEAVRLTLGHFFSGDIWDTLDFCMLSTSGISLVLLVVDYCRDEEEEEEEDDADHAFRRSGVALSLALPCVYLNTLFYLQGYQQSGILVRMVLGITLGSRLFLLILAVIVVGFALSFYVLFETGASEDDIQGYADVGSSMLSGFTLMLGDFEVDDFSASSSPNWMKFLFVIFMLLINIIMLNLLIAIMGDKYDEISENAMGEYLFSKVGIVLFTARARERGGRCLWKRCALRFGVA